jgi:hypothetical protein
MLKYRNAELFLGALFASMFWAGIWGWTDSYALTEKQKQECYDTAKKGTAKTEECKTFWERTTSDPISLFTFGLFVFTGALVAATYALYRAGEKQIALAKEVSDRQFIETQNQLDIARESNRAAIKSADAAVAAERARFYLVIEHNFRACINAAAAWDGPWEQEERPLPMDIQPMAKISFKNYGKTPGIVVEVGTGIIFSESVPDPVYDVKVVMDNIIGTERSTEGFGTLITGQMTMAQAKKVRSGEGNVWIFGYVSYDDVFGERQVHRFFQRLVCVIHHARYVLQAYDHRHYNSST